MKTVVRLLLPLCIAWIASACGDDPAAAAPGVPVAVELVNPLPTEVRVGDTIDLLARVRDSGGNGVSGVSVEFEVLEGGGTLTAPTPLASDQLAVVPTNSRGEATAAWTLGAEVGGQSLSVRGLDAEGQVFSHLSVGVTALPAN